MRIALLLPACLLIGCLIACNPPQNPDQIRERTAKATAAAKSDAKAVAQGIKEGLSTNTSVDLNAASKEQLTKLPGITEARADRIIAGRPYHDTTELVSKKVLTRSEYDQISNRVTVKK